MKKKISLILSYVVGIIGAIIVTPFALAYLIVGLFWKIFGATIIAFLILVAFNLSYEDCLKYSSGLGFFVGGYLKYREMSKQK